VVSLSNHLLRQFLLELDAQKDPGLTAFGPGPVALPGQIIGQHHVSRAEDAGGTVADTDLSAARKRNQVLSPGSEMPALDVSCFMELEYAALRGLYFRERVGALFDVQVLKVRLAVIAGVNPKYQYSAS